jgi:DNA-binding NarL/FixJ family response regulator
MTDRDAVAGSARAQPRPRVLLAEDYSPLLVALRRLLAPSCDVVGSVTDGQAVVDAADRLRPDVIVVDLNLPTLNGLEACRLIKDALPCCKIVLITAADDAAVMERAFELGASAFVLKHRVAEELGPIIQQTFLGGTGIHAL